MTLTMSDLRALPGMSEQLFDPGCPTRVVMDHVASKWGVLVLGTLTDGTRRWSELHRAVEGISEKMLASTLRALEGDGLVRRDARPVVPPYVEYSLTPRGQELVARLMPLIEWIARTYAA
jgi:DNA-binding HxlR family transcriptional regulator